MKRLVAVFVMIVLLTLGSFAILWAISPEEERENVLSTQGIRLVGSTVVNTQGTSDVPTKIKVGDLMMGSDERVYRINELRKGQTDVIYVVVSWKKINDYSSYEHYLSEPYSNHATFELRAFAYNKTITTESEIKKFYNEYAVNLQEQLSEQRAKAATARALTANQEQRRQVSENIALDDVESEPVPQAMPMPSPPPPPISDAAIPRSKPTTVSKETRAYSVVELSKPEDLSQQDEEDLKRQTSTVE